MTDKQMIRELALAIQRADDEKAPDSPLFPDDPEISDWGIHIARAAHSVIAGKVAELEEALVKAREFLVSAPLESGYCCCGSPVQGHGMGDGHSPVDSIQYAAGQEVERIDAVLESAKL